LGDVYAVRSCINGDGSECKWRRKNWEILILRTRREGEKMEIDLHGVIAPPTRHLLKERLISSFSAMKDPGASEMALSTLTQLSNLISQSVATLERISTETGIPLPDLDNPTIAAESDVLRTNATAIEAARLIAAAGLQLAALTMPPKDYVFEVVFGVSTLHHFDSCLLTAAY
jgi:hypothetical protein